MIRWKLWNLIPESDNLMVYFDTWWIESLSWGWCLLEGSFRDRWGGKGISSVAFIAACTNWNNRCKREETVVWRCKANLVRKSFLKTLEGRKIHCFSNIVVHIPEITQSKRISRLFQSKKKRIEIYLLATLALGWEICRSAMFWATNSSLRCTW